MKKTNRPFLSQLVVAILLPLLAFTPVYGYDARAQVAVPAMSGEAMAFEALLEKHPEAKRAFNGFLRDFVRASEYGQAKRFRGEEISEADVEYFAWLFSEHFNLLETALGADSPFSSQTERFLERFSDEIAVENDSNQKSKKEAKKAAKEAEKMAASQKRIDEKKREAKIVLEKEPYAPTDEALLQSYREEILQSENELTRLQSKLNLARGLRWNIKAIEEMASTTANDEERIALENVKQALLNELESRLNHLDSLNAEIKTLQVSVGELLILRAEKEAQGIGTATLTAEIEALDRVIAEKRAAAASLEKAIEGDTRLIESTQQEIARVTDFLGTRGRILAALAASTNEDALRKVAELSPLEVQELSLLRAYTPAAVAGFINLLQAEGDEKKLALEAELKKLKSAKKQIDKELSDLDKNQKSAKPTAEELSALNEIRCRLEKLQVEIVKTNVQLKRNLKITYENRLMALEVLQQWPAEDAKIKEEIASGAIRDRLYGDMNIRTRWSNKNRKENKHLDPDEQLKDVQRGKDAIDQAKAYKLFPEEFDDPETLAYLQKRFEQIAPHTDMVVPPTVFLLLDRQPITGELIPNAGALPGGFFFINVGLILKADTESELMGVIAHEIAHVAAGHSRRLMKKVGWAQIFSMAAFIALTYLAPGLFQAGSYAMYQLKGLLIQLLLSGIEIAFGLPLLGVSRDFELEADQLGVQYASAAGWDPSGFIRFFDKMARGYGYALNTSWFATHPAFAERIFKALREMEAIHAAFPERRKRYVVDSPEFQKIKAHIKEQLQVDFENKRKRMKDDPTLLKPNERPPDCPKETPVPPITTPETSGLTLRRLACNSAN